MRRLTTLFMIAWMAFALLTWGLSSKEADASVTYTSPYTYEQTFGSALRLIRVDYGFKITEKDIENGYLLFDYTSPESGKRVSQGSIEIVQGKTTVHVAVQLPSMPQYHEQVIANALAKKLVAEHGEPPKKKAPEPAPEPVTDAGTDAG